MNRCAKCNKLLAGLSRVFQRGKCSAWFCPSCMDRFCFFCKGPVGQSPAR